MRALSDVKRRRRHAQGRLRSGRGGGWVIYCCAGAGSGLGGGEEADKGRGIDGAPVGNGLRGEFVLLRWVGVGFRRGDEDEGWNEADSGDSAPSHREQGEVM